MAEKLGNSELVSFRELIMSNSIQTGALAQLLIDKGLITEDESLSKLREVMVDYQSKKAADK